MLTLACISTAAYTTLCSALVVLRILSFFDPRNVMSSQEVVDFIQSKISQRDENGELRLLSSIVEEVSLKLEEGM